MLRLIELFCLFISIYGVISQCPIGFTKTHKGSYTTTYCYRDDGGTKNFATAVSSCSQVWGQNVIMPKDGPGLDDLFKLYKSYSYSYLWVGASATPQDPFYFRYLDGSPVPAYMWCNGHPKGGSNLCAYYSTTAIIGRERCFKTSSCFSKLYDYGVICEAK